LKSFDNEQVLWDPPANSDDDPVTWHRYEGPEVSDEVEVVAEGAKDKAEPVPATSDPEPEPAAEAKPNDTEHSNTPEKPDTELPESESKKVLERANISEILKELSDEPEEVKPCQAAAEKAGEALEEKVEENPIESEQPVVSDSATDDGSKPAFAEAEEVEAMQEDEEGVPAWYLGTVAKLSWDETSKGHLYDVRWHEVAEDEEPVTTGFSEKELRKPPASDAQARKRPLEEACDEDSKRARVEA